MENEFKVGNFVMSLDANEDPKIYKIIHEEKDIIGTTNLTLMRWTSPGADVQKLWMPLLFMPKYFAVVNENVVKILFGVEKDGKIRSEKPKTT